MSRVFFKEKYPETGVHLPVATQLNEDYGMGK